MSTKGVSEYTERQTALSTLPVQQCVLGFTCASVLRVLPCPSGAWRLG